MSETVPAARRFRLLWLSPPLPEPPAASCTFPPPVSPLRLLAFLLVLVLSLANLLVDDADESCGWLKGASCRKADIENLYE